MLQGKPALLLDLCMQNRYGIVYTREILDEYAAVLSRPRFRFERCDVRQLLDFFEFNALDAEPLLDSFSRPQCNDPEDQKFYDAASCWDALLITGNKKHYPDDERVMTPVEFFEHRRLPDSKILAFLN